MRRGPVQRSVCYSWSRSSARSWRLRMSQPTRFLIAHPVCKRVAQLGARGDLQVGKYSIKVATDHSRRQKEAFGDLAVRQTFGGEVRALQRLSRQPVSETRCTRAHP